MHYAPQGVKRFDDMIFDETASEYHQKTKTYVRNKEELGPAAVRYGSVLQPEGRDVRVQIRLVSSLQMWAC